MKNEMKKAFLQLRKERSALAPTMAFHMSEIESIGKASVRETTNDETIQYLKKTVSKLKDQGGDSNEIAMLEQFLPKMATEEEIRAFLNTIDTSNKGATMKAVKEHFGVLVDMKMVKGLIDG